MTLADETRRRPRQKREGNGGTAEAPAATGRTRRLRDRHSGAVDDGRELLASVTTMSRTARPSLLRRLNERMVFDLIRRGGPTSRAELKRLMGVSAPTVSKAVARLLRGGFLEEVGVAPVGGAGRPVVVYRLARQGIQVLGAAIGARHCEVVAAGLDGRPDEQRMLRFNTPKTYPALIAALARCVRELAATPNMTTLGLGVSVPGEYDVPRQRVLLSPNVPILNGQSPATDLRGRLTMEVAVIHDITGSCLAERQYGEARDLTDFVYIGIYEGFGASIVSGGRLLEGQRGMAGELGHVTVELNGERCGCGNSGCLETVATDTAFAREASARLGRTLEVREAAKLARDGDPTARAALDRTLTYLSVGLAAAINIFNPQAIFIASRILEEDVDALDRLRTLTARRALKPLADRCRIVRIQPRTADAAVAGILDHLTNRLGPTVD